jgi:hypothetical protein
MHPAGFSGSSHMSIGLDGIPSSHTHANTAARLLPPANLTTLPAPPTDACRRSPPGSCSYMADLLHGHRGQKLGKRDEVQGPSV